MEEKKESVVENTAGENAEEKEVLELEDLEDVSGGGILSCGNGNCGCNEE